MDDKDPSDEVVDAATTRPSNRRRNRSYAAAAKAFRATISFRIATAARTAAVFFVDEEE
eukprot:CAMPEP_0175057570 /NCGR_PEP_ID=MMETSP0052_2-20121109/11334_1 /TAXON_ID=51329 ORGANISM="Polytomella parva, Strain SAG 63-3" /NCGR_SAMPLE_ID=MMETSP0052_2 /ASSEMBLY_ACC=CAM_ASM_000194 /LENGTH=58 /DNA_ID=CAMNT_0016322791 /DNA_START=361 /DNA_END=537 /DNA_ORIENTATION=-